jgi:hypothetical protein
VSLPLVLGCLWVLAAAVTAMLPMRRQMVPGLTLIVLAPVLIVWIGIAHGWWWVAIGFAAFASMFRNPLIYYYRRARGENPELPAELRSELRREAGGEQRAGPHR